MANKSQRSIWPIILIVLGFIFVAGAGLILMNLNAPSTPVSSPEILSDIPFPTVERVSLEDAKKAFDDGTATLVDVRDGQSYDQGHIPGALSIPLEEISVQKDELDPNAWIITYCT
jgi:3-mercaptopyruvate sulfurtransferase SseA